ncbi:MAG: hypothetical protein M0R33_17575 [Methylomonas sp.]|uniref:hypothetical protein n=1 Tax=Methylomonas sp. TaxID=418 RepID=UPI0025EBCDD3|nr:hypothetical protein [Methylomonas sp.]MCK9608258.1 hypothetical protein [Methylomonas sp.]
MTLNYRLSRLKVGGFEVIRPTRHDVYIFAGWIVSLLPALGIFLPGVTGLDVPFVGYFSEALSGFGDLYGT